MFAKKFISPYDDFKNFNGMSFEVLGEVDKSTYDFEEVGVKYNIKLENGYLIEALPEEIIEADQKLNNYHGYKVYE